MAKFKYSALNAEGVAFKGVEEAVTLTQARLALVGRDLEIVEVNEKKGVLQLELTKKKVPRKEVMHFSRQLAVFIKAGIPIIDGLETIVEDTANKELKKVLTEITESLRAGMTFADAAEQHPHAFPSYYLGILRSAELTGNLDVVLDQLSQYIERDLEARQRVVSALTYPAVVIVMALVSVVILGVYVLPKFRDFFAGLDAEMPLPTRIIMSVADFFQAWWWAMGLGTGTFVVGLVLALQTERGKNVRDTFLLRLPVLGDIVRHAVLERFCRILSSMVAAGVPLPEALAVTGDATNNRGSRRGLAEARELMMQG
ncbi:MAG TPA: type II secretion system F family protein, partial [Acidimicrobiales bacterium]|nr:type II secretion system F family protein [Acidimicrobiales bacterium]